MSAPPSGRRNCSPSSIVNYSVLVAPSIIWIVTLPFRDLKEQTISWRAATFPFHRMDDDIVHMTRLRSVNWPPLLDLLFDDKAFVTFDVKGVLTPGRNDHALQR
ncbi:hypothetical protein CRM22_007610 [Opisthorchis felineus]|uniref:Uncharacterized protein n=1 Tax=Opisthorchis felineus TaxID=147828 RepID=A0A4S2LFI5_OPIFE|nr:hypothetical protein CRM22_007610 [Opisthorchis felineus]